MKLPGYVASTYRNRRPRLERLSLMISSEHGGNAGASVMMEVLDPGVQAQNFLSAFEFKLLS